jgi:hypothetical protein
MSDLQYIESQYNGIRMEVPQMRSQDGTNEWQNNMNRNLLNTGSGMLFKPVDGFNTSGKTFGVPASSSMVFEADAKKAAKQENMAKAREAKASKQVAVA